MGLNNHYYKKRRMTKGAERYHKTQPVRLYQNGLFTGFRRGKTTQHENEALIQVENCADKAGAKFYLGRRCLMSSEARTPSTTPNSEFIGVLLSTLTVTTEPSEFTSRETCHQEPWVPKSDSCSIQTNKTELKSE